MMQILGTFENQEDNSVVSRTSTRALVFPPVVQRLTLGSLSMQRF